MVYRISPCILSGGQPSIYPSENWGHPFVAIASLIHMRPVQLVTLVALVAAAIARAQQQSSVGSGISGALTTWLTTNPVTVILAAFISYYVVFSYMDGTQWKASGKPWPWLATYRPLYALIGDSGYFKPKIVYDDEAALASMANRRDKQCIFGAFPHGVISLHHGILMTDTAGFLTKFPSFVKMRRDLVASVTLAVPGYRELLMWLGCVDADKKTAKRVLREGYHMYVLPGGEAEQLMTQFGKHRVFVRRRKGFVKLAIEHGASLVPVYAFGETDMYHTSNALMGFRRWLMKTFRVAVPLFWGRWGTLVPYPGPLTVVVGAPIEVKKPAEGSEITGEQIEQVHERFVEALQRLFDKHKEKCGYPEAVLEIH